MTKKSGGNEEYDCKNWRMVAYVLDGIITFDKVIM